MTYFCPECGGQMAFKGYRPLFPTCTECGQTFHIDECVEEDEAGK
ncbi:MAG: hypothetical protein ABEJ87_04420 [Candidatus Nanohalobium sp.]